jgi:outer membrane protein assembly factor BamB
VPPLRSAIALTAAAGGLILGLTTSNTFGAAAAPATSTTDTALTYQVDTSHDGDPRDDTLVPPLQQAWTVSLPDPASYPLIADGRVFVTVNHWQIAQVELYAFDLKTGSSLWGPVSLGSNINWANAAYDSGRVFTVNFNGQMQAFDAASGALQWTTQLPNQYVFTSPPAIANGLVYTQGAGSGGTVYAVRETDGSLAWTAPVDVGDHSSPAISSTGLYVSSACAETYDLNPMSGAQLWHFTTSCTGGGGRTPVLAGGKLYVRDWVVGNVVLDPATGAQLGTFAAGPAPAFSDTLGFFLNGTTLTGVQLASGGTLWTFTGDGSLTTAPLFVGDSVYVGSSAGNLYALDPVSGAQQWTANLGAGIPAPDEHNASTPLTGMGAGLGYLVVPAGNSLVALTGQETLAPGMVRFPAQVPGTSSPSTPITLTNNMSSPLAISSISITGQYSQTNSCPASLPPAATCTINVVFSPQTTGETDGNLAVTDSAAGSPHYVQLQGTGSNAAVDHIVLTPASATIQGGSSQAYQAEAYDASGTDLGNVTGVTQFSITPDGTCTAWTCTATVSGTHTVTANDFGKTATASLTVNPGPAAKLVVSPASATVQAGTGQAFRAEAYDSSGTDLGDVTTLTTFSFAGPTAGDSCAANVCSATVTGSQTINAQYYSAGGSALLTVTPGPIARIVLTPASASITAGGSQTYSVEAYDQYGNDAGNVTSATAFGIAPDGTCAGASCSASVAGRHTVTGTDGGNSATASLAVTAGPLATLTISPASSSIPAGGSVTYSASGADQYGNSLGTVTSSTIFSISPDGSCSGATCTATTAGTHTVTGTNSGKSATAAMSVSAGPLASIIVTPGTPTIAAGQKQVFTASGADQYGNPVALSTAAWSLSSGAPGSISPTTGLTTTFQAAGDKTGTATLTATSGSVHGSATITVVPGSPSPLSAVVNGKNVKLSWHSAAAAKTYALYRGTSSGSLVLYKSGLTGTSYTDTPGTGTWYYAVVAVGSTGLQSSASNTVSATVQ